MLPEKTFNDLEHAIKYMDPVLTPHILCCSNFAAKIMLLTLNSLDAHSDSNWVC